MISNECEEMPNSLEMINASHCSLLHYMEIVYGDCMVQIGNSIVGT
jgi:hypothetical protein